MTDEETARAYKAAEHFVMELKLVNEGLNAEEQKVHISLFLFENPRVLLHGGKMSF